MSGSLRRRGWRTLSRLDVTAAAGPSLRVVAVSTVLDALAHTSGSGSTARQSALLGELFGAATEQEQVFLRRLPTGELRQGALEGVMLEAIAAAAAVRPAAVRRCVHALRAARRQRPERLRVGSRRSERSRWRSAARSVPHGSGHRLPGVLRPPAAEAADLLDHALAASHEGVVVKSLNTTYVAGDAPTCSPPSPSAPATPPVANRSWSARRSRA